MRTKIRRERKTSERGFRHAPSAGNLFPEKRKRIRNFRKEKAGFHDSRTGRGEKRRRFRPSPRAGRGFFSPKNGNGIFAETFRKGFRKIPGENRPDQNGGKNAYIDYDHWQFSPAEWVRYLAAGLVMGGFAVWICYDSVYGLPVAVLLCFLYLRQKRKTLILQRRQRLNGHFKDFISALHTAMRAGYSVENGVRSAAADIQQLYGEKEELYLELREILRQVEYRRSVEQLFQDFGWRSGVEDICSFGEMLAIAKRTGGNLSAILQATWHTICEKIDTAQEIEAIIASQKMEQTVMNIMPALMILYLRISFDGFMDQLYGNLTGVCVMTLCLGLYLTALLLSQRLLRIEV